MSREPTTLSEILLRTVDRLVGLDNDCTEHNTYISTVSNDLPPNPSDVMFEVSPSGNFVFDDGHMTGAGRNALHCQTQIVVTIHITLQVDEVGRDLHYLTSADRGAVKHMTSVLEALAIHDLQDKSGNELLSHPMRPVQGWIPPKDERKRGFVTIAFEIEFDWEITSDLYSVPR